jgi:hypothetical protein
VRGDFTVDVDAAQPATVTGRGVVTWTERVVEQPRLVRIGTLSEAHGPLLPAADAVLLACGLSWSAATLQAPPVVPPQTAAAQQAPDVAPLAAGFGLTGTESPAAQPHPAHPQAGQPRTAAAGTQPPDAGPAGPYARDDLAESVAAESAAIETDGADFVAAESVGADSVVNGSVAIDSVAAESIAADHVSEAADAGFDPSQTRWEEDEDGAADRLVPDAEPVELSARPGTPAQGGEPPERADESLGGPVGGAGAAVTTPQDHLVEVWGYTVAGLDEATGVPMTPAPAVDPPDSAGKPGFDEGQPGDDQPWGGGPDRAQPAAHSQWGADPPAAGAEGSPLVSAVQAAADRRSFQLCFETAIPGAGTAQPDPDEPNAAEPRAAGPRTDENSTDEHRSDEHRTDQRSDEHRTAQHPAASTPQPNNPGPQPNSGQPPAWALNPLMAGGDEATTTGRQGDQPEGGHPSGQDLSQPVIDAWMAGQFSPAAQHPQDSAGGREPHPPPITGHPPMTDPAATAAQSPSHTGQPVDDTDVTVLTPSQLNVAVASTATPTATPPSGGELVLAVACPAGHVSPTTATFCTRCGGELGSQAQWLPRPPLGMLRASTGQAVELTGVILVGRRPISDRVVGHQVPTLFVLAGASRHISRTQLEIRVEGWTILGRNVSNSNEVPLRRPGEPEVNLARSALLPLAIGDVLDLGDGIHLTLEGPG